MDDSLRVLIAARKKVDGVSPFVEEQAQAIERQGVTVELHAIEGKGARAYVDFVSMLASTGGLAMPQIVHAHFGVCGLAATMQRRIPVAVTYHGSDINQRRLRVVSRIAARRAAANIVVSSELAALASFPTPPDIIPCGIDLDLFSPEDPVRARAALGYGREKVVVFASSRGRTVKNVGLADRAVEALPEPVRMIELRGFSRQEVRTVLSAADVLLMTSRSEGSPQVVKEALAVGCPVVSTDVGDVSRMIRGLPGCYIVAAETDDIARKLWMSLESGLRVSCRDRLLPLASDSIAAKVVSVYRRILASRARATTTNA